MQKLYYKTCEDVGLEVNIRVIKFMERVLDQKMVEN